MEDCAVEQVKSKVALTCSWSDRLKKNLAKLKYTRVGGRQWMFFFFKLCLFRTLEVPLKSPQVQYYHPNPSNKHHLTEAEWDRDIRYFLEFISISAVDGLTSYFILCALLTFLFCFWNRGVCVFCVMHELQMWTSFNLIYIHGNDFELRNEN